MDDHEIPMGSRLTVDVAGLNYSPNSKLVGNAFQSLSNYLPTEYKKSLVDFWNKVIFIIMLIIILYNVCL
jgi:hypothetical protein